MEEILRLFPEQISQAVQYKIDKRWSLLQEIRFRLGRPIELVFDHHTEWMEHIKPDKRDSMYVLNQLSEFSLYRMENELREGYITIEGGHRVGLAGKVNTKNGFVKTIQHITFMNIRIAKEKIGCAIPIIPYMHRRDYKNTLFIGAPQTGKTTLIRDIVRLIATGWNHVGPKKVAVIDERSEIAGCIKGIPQHDIGLRADVMDACPKSEGMMMMIRSMSPDILVVDEIGTHEEVQAMMEAINAGVVVICTIHGRSINELKKRPSLHVFFQQRVFERFVLLDKYKGAGYVRGVYNQNGETIVRKSGGLQSEMDWRTSFHKHDNRDRLRSQ